MISLLFSRCHLPPLAYAISNLFLYLIRNYKITNKVFESFIQILSEKNKRSDQVKYFHVP